MAGLGDEIQEARVGTGAHDRWLETCTQNEDASGGAADLAQVSIATRLLRSDRRLGRRSLAYRQLRNSN